MKPYLGLILGWGGKERGILEVYNFMKDPEEQNSEREDTLNYPLFQGRDERKHTLNGFRNQHTQIFGTWTPWANASLSLSLCICVYIYAIYIYI